MQKSKTNDVQMHIDNAFEIIDEFLPTQYVDKVLEKLPENTSTTKGVIRNIRNRTNKNASRRIDVLNALVEVALENKMDLEKLKIITTKN